MSLFFSKEVNLPIPQKTEFELRTKALHFTSDSGQPFSLSIERETVQRTFYSDDSVDTRVVGETRSIPVPLEKFQGESGSADFLKFMDSYGDKLDQEFYGKLIDQLTNETK